jgi:hypothetical protein
LSATASNTTQALGERRPQLSFRDTAIVGHADGRERRCEQPHTHLVCRGEATVEVEDDRFGHSPRGRFSSI